jgi:cytochrome c oxidase subunit 2
MACPAPGWLPLIAVGLLVAACGGTTSQYPQSTLIPKGDFATMVDDVFMTTVRWAVLVFVLVEGALLFAIWKFRGKPGDGEPEQSHGNTTVEIIWTVIPAAILAFIAVPTVRTIFRTAETPAGALEVEVIGHQWWWEFRYPELGLTTANELHVPVGRTVSLKIRTDVLTASGPAVRRQAGRLPNKHNALWFTTDSLGVFSGQCAEFCGTQHGRMHSYVVVQTPRSSSSGWPGSRSGRRWSTAGWSRGSGRHHPPPPPVDPGDGEGQGLFIAGGCVGCHAMVGQPTAGLTSLPGRT